MKGKKTLHNVGFAGFLSFPENAPVINLEPLNVIVGSNASGKSNFLHGFRMLRGIAGDVNQVFRDLGGSGITFFRGKEKSEVMRFSCSYIGKDGIGRGYKISVSAIQPDNWEFINEGFNQPKPNEGWVALDKLADPLNPKTSTLSLALTNLSLAPLEFLKETLNQIWQNTFEYENCVTTVKREQQSDFPRSFPQENFKNLGVVLSEIEKTPHFRDDLYKYLRRVIPRFERIHIDPRGSQLMIYFYEKGITDPIPATRLSDGTLHLLCLLTVLLHPKPPPIVCLEEPDLGLHPDAIHVIAEVLIDASKRTQIICTTHSPLLVSAIGDQFPEAIVVCERDEDGTKLTRLDAKKMEKWLEEFTLGDLWVRGEIGGGITDA